MFKVFFAIASFLTAFASENALRGEAISSFLDDSDEWKQFSNFQERFSKQYETFEEVESRFQIFRTNLRNIIIHNLDHSQNFTMGINQFTDLTPNEFKAQYVGGLKAEAEVGSYGCKTFSSGASGAPDSIDWRTKGAVTSVKDQGQCGSCWTFSATGAIEGAWAIAKGQLIDLSEEQLVECATGMSYGSHGCNGGIMEGAFKYVIEHGQCSLSSYPYTSGTGESGSCKSCSSVAHMSSCSDVKPNDQISLKAALAKQPVAVAISADTRVFQSYTSGVITSSSCYTSLDHGVLAVGYGTENGIEYYLVKNSWGESWGENGYVKIGRSDSTNDAGICGIAMDPSFPTV
jgi:C1A family cysteine protease